jgi:hypothetical protein
MRGVSTGLLLLTLACESSLEFGDAPKDVMSALGCNPLSPSDAVAFGSQVLGRSGTRVVTLTNCSGGRRTLGPLTLSPTGPAFLLGRASAGLTAGAPVDLEAGQSAFAEIVFSPVTAGVATAQLELVVGGESFVLPLQGMGQARPTFPAPMTCQGNPRMVNSSVLLSADTDPTNPDVTLALLGVDPGQCFAVEGDVLVVGTLLPNLDVLRGLTAVHGDLSVGHALGGNRVLENVDGLANLQRVDGQVSISGNPALRTLDGLTSLSSVGRGLSLEHNVALQDVYGLQGLTAVGGDLNISNNPRVQFLDGLEGLTTLGGGLRLVGDTALADVEALHALPAVPGSLSVAFNSALKSIAGLRGVATVGPYLGINNNAALANLDGLQGLTHAGQLVVAQNGSLSSLAGLNSVTHAQVVVVSYNAALQDLSGLGALQQVDLDVTVDHNTQLKHLGMDALTAVGGVLTIMHNPALPTSEANALATRASVTHARIEGNAP